MSALAVAPIVVPLATAVATLLLGRSARLQRTATMVGSAVFVAVALALLASVRDGAIAVARIGAWPPPFGIAVVADMFGALMAAATAVIGFAVTLFAMASPARGVQRFAFHPMLQFLLAGCSGALLTGDLFNLYVWLEVILISSSVLIAAAGGRVQLEGAVSYIAFNLLASALLLAAIGITYAVTGTLAIAQLARIVPAADPGGPIGAVAVLLLLALAIKGALFPFFFWLPVAYPAPPIEASIILGGLVTKVSLCVLLRLFTLVFVADAAFTHRAMLVAAALTMIAGVVGAYGQSDLRRILSFHVVSQIGFIVFGVALLTPLAIAGAIYFTLHNIFAKTALFLASGVVAAVGGSFELGRLGGMRRRSPLVALLFLVPALALAGIPPLPGFFGKLALFEAGLAGGHHIVVAAAIATSIVTLLSMMKIWNEAFLRPVAEEGREERISERRLRPMVASLGLVSMLTLAIGLAAGPLFDLAFRAAEQMLEREPYVRAVLQ